MFGRWGAFVVRARWVVIAAAVALVIVGATWGAGVFGHLASGGFLDQNSPSAQVRNQINAAFGPQDADIFVLYTAKAGAITDAGRPRRDLVDPGARSHAAAGRPRSPTTTRRRSPP